MEYKNDSSGNKFLKIPLGWGDTRAKLRLTYVDQQKTIRLNKLDKKNHVYPGPEFELKFVPELIEALANMYNNNKEKE